MQNVGKVVPSGQSSPVLRYLQMQNII